MAWRGLLSPPAIETSQPHVYTSHYICINIYIYIPSGVYINIVKVQEDWRAGNLVLGRGEDDTKMLGLCPLAPKAQGAHPKP